MRVGLEFGRLLNRARRLVERRIFSQRPSRSSLLSMSRIIPNSETKTSI